MGNEQAHVHSCPTKNCKYHNPKHIGILCDKCKEMNVIEGRILRKYIKAMEESTSINIRKKLLNECKDELEIYHTKNKLLIELIDKTIESQGNIDTGKRLSSTEESWKEF
jgi:hypothetical protein